MSNEINPVFVFPLQNDMIVLDCVYDSSDKDTLTLVSACTSDFSGPVVIFFSESELQKSA